MTALKGRKLLLFTKTAWYRHESIQAGVPALRRLADANEFQLVATEDAGIFTAESLAEFDTTVWLSTTGDVLSGPERIAFEGFVREGGGFVGIHSAANTETSWPFFQQLVGATFQSQPGIHLGTVRIEDHSHPSVTPLPSTWSRVDEWYNYRTNPRGQVRVLATVDEASYDGGTMGSDHPIVWCHDTLGGRSWYTGLGHTSESFTDELMLQHILGGVASVSRYRVDSSKRSA